MNLNIERFYKSFPTLSHRRNRFPWEKSVNFNMKMGEITPLCAIPVAPGVTYNLDLATVIKVAPLVVPPQDVAVFKTFAFYDSNRNNWDNYPYWFGEKKNPEDPENENTYLVPKVDFTNTAATVNSFYDNIGHPIDVTGYKTDKYITNIDRSIYNNYFRNQVLENPLPIDRTDADIQPTTNMALRKISKPRDLFTGSLPTASGTSQVEIPLGSEAPVVGNGNYIRLTANTPHGGTNVTANWGLAWKFNEMYNFGHLGLSGSEPPYTIPKTQESSVVSAIPDNSMLGLTQNGESGLVADLSRAMGAPLEGLYQAIAYNTYQYMTSRGGNRYFEQLSNIYGITNPEGVLRIPEFLGSTSQYIDFETVTQTSSTTGQETPLGNRAANGYMENYGNIINKSFGEFGWIIIYGVVTHYPKYQQGINKLMQTEDVLDLYNPIFNLMGDEPIYKSEIYLQSDSVVNENGEPVNDEVWGYNKRHSRYIYPLSEIHGEQRSAYAQSLDANHFAEYYEEMPVLNKTFDKVTDVTLKRALQVTEETQFVGNCLVTGTIDIEIPLESIPSPFPDLQMRL